MLQKFKTYYSDSQPFKTSNKILLAVSGGLDSVVMSKIFYQSNLNFGIAHCNFKLRGKDADNDLKFVQKLAKSMKVAFFSIEFETEKFAKENGLSIQVAARDLRYDWLEKIRSENNFDYIATAHHLDDSIETAIYNFTKGTGIRGLLGIPQKNGKIIRPMLFATRKEIEEFAQKENLDWREDSSNSETKYARNKIRHKVIPVLKELNPNFGKTAANNFSILHETEKLFQFSINLFKKEILKKEEGLLKIDKEKLCSSPAPLSILYEILKDYDFNANQCQNILQNIDNQSGGIHFTSTYKILNNRDFLILTKKENYGKVNYYINKLTLENKFPFGNISMELLENPPSVFPKNSDIAFFDFDKIKFPLLIRNWKEGDKFCPLGMNGKHQKVQDFFSNNKLSRFEKEKVLFLECDGEICWIIGHRLDDRFKINLTTKQVLKVIFERNPQ